MSAFAGNPSYTFENFVVGPSNALAHAAAHGVAEGARLSPIFLCGGTSLGKTHLLQAIAHKLAPDEKKRVVYTSAEDFTNELVGAFQHKRIEAFRERYRTSCDVLLIDDVEFLSGREQTQDELFHTFNTLHQLGCPIVLTSDRFPRQLERMEERLVSRFSWGLVADIRPPDLTVRVMIVERKAKLLGIEISTDVALVIAEAVTTNVRELEGMLLRVSAKASVTHQPIDVMLVRGELSTVVEGRIEKASISDIQRLVAQHFHLRASDMVGPDRHKTTAFARHVAMYLCKKRLKVSFPELGRAFGRDHTTIIASVRKIEDLREKDPSVQSMLDVIEKKVTTGEPALR